MKALSTLIISILFTSALYAQPTIQWQHAYGGSGDEGAYDIKPAVNGGFIFCGETNSVDGDITDTGYGNSDYWLCRIDSSGNILWEKSYGGTDYERAFVMLNTTNGYLLAGSASSATGEITSVHGGGDVWLVKTDTSGNLLWEKTYGGSAWDEVAAICKTTDGGYVFVGDTYSTDGDITFNHGGASDIWVVKINDTGKIMWQRCYGGSLNDYGNDVIQTTDGGYFIAGSTSSTDGDATGSGFHGWADCWFIKIDDTGAIQWQKCYGGGSVDVPGSVLQTLDGGYVVAATTLSTDGDITNGTTTDYFDAWLFKIDSAGTMVWNKTYGGSKDADANKILNSPDGGYIFSGVTNSHDGDVTGTHGDTSDYWVVKINDTGKLIWQKTMGGTQQELNYTLTPFGDSSYIVAGYTNSFDGDVTGNHGGSDAWLVRLGYTDTTTSTATVSNTESIKVYPTLSNGIVHVVVPTGYGAAKISLINTLGQQIPFTKSVNGNEHVIDLSGNSMGMYIVRVSCNGVVKEVKVMYRP